MLWSLWLKPLQAWLFLIISIYFATLYVLFMLRKQWMENERLLFPLATLPLELGRQESDTWLPPLLRNYLTWVGFAVPFVVYAVNGLHSYFSFFTFYTAQYLRAFFTGFDRTQPATALCRFSNPPHWSGTGL